MRKTLLTIVLLLMGVARASAADQGFFNCFHLSQEQRAWFSSDGITNCCQLADGMPTMYEERVDGGTYVPPYEKAIIPASACRDDQPNWDNYGVDRSDWVRVDADRVLRKNNAIGVAVVWWTNAGVNVTSHDVRCLAVLTKA